MLLVIWSVLNRLVYDVFGRVLSILSDRIRDQLLVRENLRTDLISLAEKRQDYGDAILFFCSSAGEFEQARPLIDKLSANRDLLCHVIFFSASGAKFVRARKDDVSWSMSPLDDAGAWHEIFTVLRPSMALIVRHELWPSFLWVAAQYCEIVVINAVIPSLFGRQSAWKDKVNVWIKSWLMRFVDRVFVVTAADREFFVNWLRVSPDLVQVSGDTKYDRVIQRASQKQAAMSDLRERFSRIWPMDGFERTLIIGSAHLPDVQWLVDSLASEKLAKLRILVVPHDVSSGNVAKIYDAFRQHKLTVELLSEIESGAKSSGESPRVLIADEMGRLSELYGLADYAWIGGAAHHKVHNVLEPAAWGIPVLCGPHYQNSQEAVAMANAGVLRVIATQERVLEALIDMMASARDEGDRARHFAREMSGATELVLNSINATRHA
jgi:3-deoxy-D-manno-octulosonic-acid transferase